ncbi:hypothetical protein TSUD_372230 [Trifolium subterraneum]|uniref:Uncharacterized protein n=1 Tax=Trifolium subterraneum TaxID=3900 RepID=A0A2Z6LU69_TRISU|nr:hypothetical protein TSUD_372230 [Trifolium subterraneum]
MVAATKIVASTIEDGGQVDPYREKWVPLKMRVGTIKDKMKTMFELRMGEG